MCPLDGSLTVCNAITLTAASSAADSRDVFARVSSRLASRLWNPALGQREELPEERARQPGLTRPLETSTQSARRNGSTEDRGRPIPRNLVVLQNRAVISRSGTLALDA